MERVNRESVAVNEDPRINEVLLVEWSLDCIVMEIPSIFVASFSFLCSPDERMKVSYLPLFERREAE